MSYLWIEAAGHDSGASYMDEESGLHFPVPGLHDRRLNTLVPLSTLSHYSGDPYDHRGIEREVARARADMMSHHPGNPEESFLAWQRKPIFAKLPPVRLMRTSSGHVRMTGGKEFVNAAHDLELDMNGHDGFHAIPTQITDMRHPGRSDRPPVLYHGTSTAGLTHITPAIGHAGLEYAKHHSPEADHHFAYATANLAEATHYARGHAAAHDAEPLVYRVRPMGHLEPDPPHNPADHLKLNERCADVRCADGFAVEHTMHPGWY